jgi:DNA ligase (NAD+)
VVAEAVAQHLADEHNRGTIEKLRAAGVRLLEERPARAEGPLSGCTFVLTGKLPALTRGEAQALIEAQGGRVSGSVSRATDFVVVGEDAGSKLEKARTLGVQTLDEGALRELLAAGETELAGPAEDQLPLG